MVGGRCFRTSYHNPDEDAERHTQLAGATSQFRGRFQIASARSRSGCEEPPSTLPRCCGRCGCHPELRACCRLPQVPRSCGLALRRRREHRSCIRRRCRFLSTTRAARSDHRRRGYDPGRPGQLRSYALPSLAPPSINARFHRSPFRLACHRRRCNASCNTRSRRRCRNLSASRRRRTF